MPCADRARDPEAEGVGRGARPGDQGVERETQAQEEGKTDRQFPFMFHFVSQPEDPLVERVQ